MFCSPGRRRSRSTMTEFTPLAAATAARLIEIVVFPSPGRGEVTTTVCTPCSAIVASERSEEHTSELQSLMRSSYDVFCLKKTKNIKTIIHYTSVDSHFPT